MATLSDVIISLRGHDELGIKGSLPLYCAVDDTATLAHILGECASAAEVAEALTGMQIDSWEVIVRRQPTLNMKTAPVADSLVEETALFNFSQINSTYKYGVDIPAILPAAVVDGRVDLTNAGVQAFVDWMTGLHTYISTMVSKYGFLLGALMDVLCTFRKHRKALDRRSFNTPVAG